MVFPALNKVSIQTFSPSFRYPVYLLVLPCLCVHSLQFIACDIFSLSLKILTDRLIARILHLSETTCFFLGIALFLEVE